MNVAAQIRLTPGDRHQPADLRRPERIGRDQLLDRLDLLVEELDLAQRRLDRLALVRGQLELRKPAAAPSPEQVRERGAAD